MSIGQFLEMRYNRPLRIFACFVRSIAELMANIIMPAIAETSIQKSAPAPPAEIAVATPTIFPVPIVAASAEQSDKAGETLPSSPFAKIVSKTARGIPLTG